MLWFHTKAKDYRVFLVTLVLLNALVRSSISNTVPDKSGIDILKDLGINKKIANTLVGEAVGEGEEGMRMVFNVMRNQSGFFGQTLQDTAKTKYSAYRRPDLAAFVSKQPEKLVKAAYNIVANPTADTTNGALHFENIDKYGIPAYAKKEGGLIPLSKHKNHTAFITLREYKILINQGKMRPGLEASLITNKEQYARYVKSITGTTPSK